MPTWRRVVYFCELMVKGIASLGNVLESTTPHSGANLLTLVVGRGSEDRPVNRGAPDAILSMWGCRLFTGRTKVNSAVDFTRPTLSHSMSALCSIPAAITSFIDTFPHDHGPQEACSTSTWQFVVYLVGPRSPSYHGLVANHD